MYLSNLTFYGLAVKPYYETFVVRSPQLVETPGDVSRKSHTSFSFLTPEFQESCIPLQEKVELLA